MNRITVIIPCYNVEKYIGNCIESVFKQNLQESDFELIIVNDGSTDQSLSITEKLVFNKYNVKIISQDNRGLGAARNAGILNATGAYLLFLDADDWLVPNALKDALDIAEKEELDVLEFSAQGVNSDGKILYHYHNNSRMFSSGTEYYKKVRYMNSACNKLYKRLFLVDHHILFLEEIFIEDFEFNTRCLAKAQRLRATNLLVAQFLQSENSITRNTNQSNRQKMIGDIVQVLKITENQYKRQSVADQKDFYLERLNFLVASLFVQLFKNKASYNDIQNLKSELVENRLYYIDYKIFDLKKNILRMVLLKNLRLYKLIQLFY